MGDFLRRRPVLVSLRGYRLSDFEVAALAKSNAEGGFPGLAMRVDAPALERIAASRELDRADEGLRRIRFDGRPPATDLPPKVGGARW